jgi:hypothetical protein
LKIIILTNFSLTNKEAEIVNQALFEELKELLPNHNEIIAFAEVNDPYQKLYFPKNPIRSNYV